MKRGPKSTTLMIVQSVQGDLLSGVYEAKARCFSIRRVETRCGCYFYRHQENTGQSVTVHRLRVQLKWPTHTNLLHKSSTSTLCNFHLYTVWKLKLEEDYALRFYSSWVKFFIWITVMDGKLITSNYYKQ